MKRTQMQWMVYLLLAAVMAAAPSYAMFNSDIKKAKKFISIGMVPQAVTLLEKSIFDHPTDGEAHFLLGTLYIQQGELGEAEQRFKSAVMIDPDFGYKIGGEYRKEGISALSREQYNKADRLLNTAIEYQPSLAKEIGREYFNTGKRQLSNGDKYNLNQ